MRNPEDAFVLRTSVAAFVEMQLGSPNQGESELGPEIYCLIKPILDYLVESGKPNATTTIVEAAAVGVGYPWATLPVVAAHAAWLFLKDHDLRLKESLVAAAAMQVRGGVDRRNALQQVLPRFIEIDESRSDEAAGIIRAIMNGRDMDLEKSLSPVWLFWGLRRKLENDPVYKERNIRRLLGTRNAIEWSFDFPVSLSEFLRSEGIDRGIVGMKHGKYDSGLGYVQIDVLGNGKTEDGRDFRRSFYNLRVQPPQEFGRYGVNPFNVLSIDRVKARVGRPSGGLAWQESSSQRNTPHGLVRYNNVTVDDRYYPQNSHTEDWWAHVSDGGLTVLSQPMSVELPDERTWPIERRRVIEDMSFANKLIVLGRILFKAVESEQLLALTEQGVRLLENAQGLETPYIDGNTAQIVRRMVRNLKEELRLQDLTMPENVLALESFKRSVLVAMGMNAPRGWRHSAGLSYLSLFHWLSNINAEEVYGDLLMDEEVSQKIVESASNESVERAFKGINVQEFAVDCALEQLTYLGEATPEFMREHFEFGWNKLARVLRKYVAPEIAAVDDDVELLVRVFDLEPELDWA